jgi:hypothetical protein
MDGPVTSKERDFTQAAERMDDYCFGDSIRFHFSIGMPYRIVVTVELHTHLKPSRL